MQWEEIVMILNIHGYGSSGKNSKYEFLAAEYKDQLLISPSFDYSTENPYNIRDTLRNRLILNFEKDKKNIILGSSLGGFFAYCLCTAFEIKTILINPSLMPFINLSSKYGANEVICKKYIELFNEYVFEANSRDYEIIAGDKDDVIDHELITRAVVGPAKKFHVVEGRHDMPLSDEVKNLIRSIIASAD